MKNRWTLRSKHVGVVVDFHHDTSLCTVLWTTPRSYRFEAHVKGALIDASSLGTKDEMEPEECTSA